jgi:hypothetical protein
MPFINVKLIEDVFRPEQTGQIVERSPTRWECGVTARNVDRFTLHSTGGPVENLEARGVR